MYQGKRTARNSRSRNSIWKMKVGTLALALVLLLATVGGTLAWLATSTAPIENVFTPSTVTVEVEEDFDGTVKKNVTAKNTGDIDAYIRIKLVSYRVNEDGDRIGGTVVIPAFTLGAGWVESGDFYYYTKPVAPGKTPAADLIGDDGITFEPYTDADGGMPVIEVLAEAIQAVPADAVENAWGFDPATLG